MDLLGLSVDLSALPYAFALGMVATVNPCGFAMLPAYVAFYLATGGSSPAAPPPSGGRRLGRALVVGGTLTLGFLVLFAASGAVITAGGMLLIDAVPWLGIVLGVVLASVGVWRLTGRRLPVPVLPRIHVPRERALWSVFLFGMAYGLVSLTCTLPLFLGVVGGALTQDGVAAGTRQFVGYGLGMGTVLIALTVSLALFEGALVGPLRKMMPYVEKAGAITLVVVGGYVVYYWVDVVRLMGI